uniref:Uncharacterized protein MANES_03G145900 n=1 Tax=Rhizophora mucronata TaxID=61149 RepID=A0A2P2JWP8_RHIMU
MLHCNTCSSKVMKHQWSGNCFCISTSSIHLIGTIKVPCQPSCSSTELDLQLYMQWFVLELFSRCII